MTRTRQTGPITGECFQLCGWKKAEGVRRVPASPRAGVVASPMVPASTIVSIAPSSAAHSPFLVAWFPVERVRLPHVHASHADRLLSRAAGAVGHEELSLLL